ncbi:MAG: hypothetical protein ABIP74_03345 [Candidatus Saccharimonas sp.]
MLYLEYWRTEIKDASKLPNEERFWAWYCLEILNNQQAQPKSVRIEDILE